MFWLKIVKSIMGILHSDIPPAQIAAGFVLGSIIGFAPFVALHTILVLILILVLNVNIGAALMAIAACGTIGLFTDPLADRIGTLLLVKSDLLTPLWTYAYNLPLVPFTRFNNTVVLGSLVIAMGLSLPLFFLVRRGVRYYRAHLAPKVEQWKVMKLLKITSPLNVYNKYQQ